MSSLQRIPQRRLGAADNQIVSEASLHGHLRNEQAARDGKREADGSSAYVNPDKSKDTQLNYALDLVRGVKSVQAAVGRD